MNTTKKNQTVKTKDIPKWTISDTLAIVFKTLFWAVIIGVPIIFGYFLLKDAAELTNDTTSYLSAREDVSEGIITDKKIFSSHANVFRPASIEYRIYITAEYIDENNSTVTITKFYGVPESVYLSYEIGDYFDSNNYSIGDKASET